VPARPVADAPVAVLIAAPDALARDWLVALLARAPLETAAAVPVADLAREAPALCSAMVRALASELELERLAQGDLAGLAARAGALAGAREPAAAVEAIETLRGVLWAAALGELRRPEPALVADLADRLAAVTAVVSAASLRATSERVPPSPLSAPESAAPPSGSAAPAPPETGAPASGPAASGPPETLAPTPPASEPRVVPDAPAPSPLHAVGEPSRWDPTDAVRTVQQAAGAVEPEVRDLRPRIQDGRASEHIAHRVADHLVDHRTLAELLVELDGVERLVAAGDDALAAAQAAEHALEGLLRQGDGARREGPGRVWITLPGTGPAGARALALRIAVAVERAAEHRGAPLTVSSGIAVFPGDAVDAEALMDRAEEALFRARAGGVR
jgi:GGDEF domain-containing protein